MFRIGNYPFIRILFPYMTGIAIGDRLWGMDFGVWLWIAPVALFFLLTFWVHRVIPMVAYRYRWFPGVCLTLLFLLLGFLGFRPSDGNNRASSHLLEHSSGTDGCYAMAVITRDLQAKASSLAGIIKVIPADSDIGFECNVVAYFYPDSAASSLLPGDTIVFLSRFRKINPPLNPDAFDYQRYMRRKGIDLSVYLGDGSWMLHNQGDPGMVMRTVLQIRGRLIDAINHGALKDPNKGLGQALLIGVKEELDEDVSNSFAAAGAIHVLCVSGLHVGMIFVIFSSLFKFVKRIRKWGNLIFTLAGLAVIWCYALVTGLPPSVNRASVMFSFILLGKLMGRKNQTMNNVAASAFIILMSDPSLLFHVGFQLSYLAVIGIITLFPVLSTLWIPRWRFLVSVRDLLIVSFCAQLFTFPVATATFHLFPNYFLLTNLLVLPVTSFVIWAGVAFLATGSSLLNDWCTLVFDNLLSLMRGLVGFVDGLPGSSSDGVFITPSQVWLLLGASVALTLWLHGAGKRWFFITLSGLAVFLGSNIQHEFSRNRQDLVVVYHVKKGTAVDLLKGRSRVTMLGDDSVSVINAEFAAGSFRIKSGVYHNKRMNEWLICTPDENVMFQRGNFSLLFLRKKPVADEKPVQCDIAAIGPGIWPDSAIFGRISAKYWVVDGAVPFYKTEKWKSLAGTAGIDLWDTSDKGALLISGNGFVDRTSGNEQSAE
ncbi:MAG: ComEC/Rec2 family competence protein [Bacteroidales bacterium]